MEKQDKKTIFLLLRYLILLVLVFNSYLIYKILTPITVYFTAGLLNLFYKISILGTNIIINQTKTINITAACVAGSAYILLLILNLFVAMKPKQRIYSILFSTALLLIFNVLRIVILAILFVNHFEYLYLTHKLIWYILSTVFVIGIWFLTIKLFKIKQIPIVSDIKPIIKNIKRGF